MRFFLVYRGPLTSTQSKQKKTIAERINIRKQIAPQMERLWTTRNLVELQWDARVPINPEQYLGSPASPFGTWKVFPPEYPPEAGYADLAAPIIKHGKPFRPLIRESLNLTCTLKILFLRQEDPGALIKRTGDIDNRIKTFIDALELPTEGLEGDENDQMNYPLLENDTLVRGLEINTERLLLPETHFLNEVHLIAEVIVHVERPATWNLCLL